MTVDVIMLSLCQDEEMFKMNTKCINSLNSSEEDHQFNIYLIESNKEFEKLGLAYTSDNVNVIIPPQDFNYNAFLNIGLEYTKSDFVVISNNDLIYQKKWFSEILKVKNSHKDILSFCPYDHKRESHLKEHFKDSIALGYRLKKELVGWCIVIDRKLFEKMPMFDESFPYYFQDNDYGNTLRKLNIPHARVFSSHVTHLESQTSRVNRRYTYENRGAEDEKIYLQKWGSYKKQYYRNKIHEHLVKYKLHFFTRILYWI